MSTYPYKFTYYTGRGRSEQFHERIGFYSNAGDANINIPAMLDADGINYKRLRIERMTDEEFQRIENKVFLVITPNYQGVGLTHDLIVGYQNLVYYCAGISFDKEWFTWAYRCENGEYITSISTVVVCVG